MSSLRPLGRRARRQFAVALKVLRNIGKVFGQPCYILAIWQDCFRRWQARNLATSAKDEPVYHITVTINLTTTRLIMSHPHAERLRSWSPKPKLRYRTTSSSPGSSNWVESAQAAKHNISILHAVALRCRCTGGDPDFASAKQTYYWLLFQLCGPDL